MPLRNLLGSIFHVVGAGIDAARGKRRVVFECMGRLPNVPSKPVDDVGSGSLLLLCVIPEVIRGSLRNFRGSAGGLLELVTRHVLRRPQRIAGALTDLGACISDLALQTLRGRKSCF